MHCFQKIVVLLWRVPALRIGQRHCWKEKTLVVYWVSETAKSQSPEEAIPISNMNSNITCSDMVVFHS